jgi:hypothetical protein
MDCPSLSEFQALISAIESQQAGAADALVAWCASHDVNACLTDLAAPDRPPLRHGSPLYVACVCNSDAAVRVLLDRGADPSARFLDELGLPADCPILHCAERGYHECLALLLGCQERPVALDAVTHDKKTFLGQSMAVYTVGGENVCYTRILLRHVTFLALSLFVYRARKFPYLSQPFPSVCISA